MIFEDSNLTLQLLPVKDDPQCQHLTLSQAYHLINNNKKKQVVTEKPKQEANVSKKPVLESYCGQIAQSKVNSFRKPLQVKDKSSAKAEKSAPAVSKAMKPQPGNTDKVTVREDRASDITAAPKCVSTAPQDRQLTQPPIRSHHNTQEAVKQGLRRTSAGIPIQKGPRKKEWLKLNAVLSGIKTSSTQDVKRIYENAILVGVQPIEEMGHAIVDILTMSQEKIKFRENRDLHKLTEENIVQRRSPQHIVSYRNPKTPLPQIGDAQRGPKEI
ncbi:Cytoskeleton-associated protein 2 [Manis javanica]|nr:Cytoskeleton-associated protein 2 [Manis javanica]